MSVKYTSEYGTDYELEFINKGTYMDGTPAIEVGCKEEGCDWWEPYADLTVCLGDGKSHIDTNNVKHLCEFVIENGWAKVVGEPVTSGFCTYPTVEFTDGFADMFWCE